METARFEPLLDGLTFPEAPRWHEGRLWFSDFYSFRVMTVAPDGRAEVITHVPQRPSGLGWTPDGALLVVSMLDHKLLRLDGSALTEVADLSAFAGGPCNDMVVDAQGRAYVGNFGYDRHAGQTPRTTCLARVDPDGTVMRAADDLMFPNGTVITPDGRTLIVGETFAERLTAFAIAPDGSLGARRVFAHVPGMCADGICLDAEGAVWVADPFGKKLLRILADGRVDRLIGTGERGPYACMLGGPDRRTLFVCTNSGSGPAMGQKRDGRIELMRVDVPGAGLP